MARIRNEKYGISSSNADVHILKQMGVSDKNIYPLSNANTLFKQMFAGDILCVASVGSFAVGAYDLFSKMVFLSNNGIEFRSGNEKYLNFSSVAPLSMVSRSTLENFAKREIEFAKYVQVGNISNVAKTQLANRIRWEFLTSITNVFRNEGIKKRGN